MKRIVLFIGILLAVQCREKYDVFVDQKDFSLLVVDGSIAYGDSTNIYLSRSTVLSEKNILPEKNATVQIQGEDNSVYPLTEKDSGRYTAGNLPLDPNGRYRIWIETSNNKQYASDYSDVLVTPAIDSLSWFRDSSGVQIVLNAHGTPEQSPYYKFDYKEVWEFKSDSKTAWEWDLQNTELFNTIIGVKTWDTLHGRFPEYNESMYTCYKYHDNGAILLGNTSQLSENKVYYPLISHKKAAWALSYLYSVNVTQRCVSRDAYDFFIKMKRNTEQLGSVFDAQPTQIKGNIHCLTVPDELVIGFVEAASVKQKRLFINNNELPGWGYKQECSYESISFDPPLPWDPFYYEGWHIAVPGFLGSFVRFATDRECVDCRTRGVSAKPDFWP